MQQKNVASYDRNTFIKNKPFSAEVGLFYQHQQQT